MSNRYVWKLYSLEKYFAYIDREVTEFPIISWAAPAGRSFVIDKSDITFNLTGYVKDVKAEYDGDPAVKVEVSAPYVMPDNTWMLHSKSKRPGDMWALAKNTGSEKGRYKVIITDSSKQEGESNGQIIEVLGIKEVEPTKDKFLGYIASPSKNSYPDNGIYSGNWYEYLGQDTIDPSAVTYSEDDLSPGEPVTITVTPVTPTYGGTVYYLYQYSIDGGSTWATIGSKTTDTSVTMTIPEGATQFQARVTASDRWAFTSTTPVKGPNLGVSQLKAYAAVSGVSRAGVKMYATVDGKIREIQKGYATVGGKIRKLF